MRPELSLLKLLLDHEVYLSYREYIQINKDERDLVQLYKLLDQAHETFQRTITFNEFYVYVLSNIVGSQHTVKTILDRLETLEIGQDVAQQLLTQCKERSNANELAIKAIEVSEGRRNYSELTELIKKHTTDNSDLQAEDPFITDDLTLLHESAIKKHGLRWRLKSLNTIFGSLRQGNFGFIFARPESGKTTFLASEATYMASQVPDDAGPVLWFNNEEDGKQVQLRIFQACLGVTRYELFSDLPKYNDLYHQIIRGKLKVIDNASIHKRDIEKYCEQYNPSLIIIDQGDKVKGFDGDREDLKLGSTYQWMREIAKKYCPVISVTQSDGSGEGKKWLTMENVANAKTAKQAEADWILGIGATHQEGFEYVRHLHASKNKLPGDEDSDPKQRHGKVDVIIEPEIARYKDYE
jgi:hypothetical protein